MSQWAIELRGDRSDLQEWAEVLKPPSDPWIEKIEGKFCLRASVLDDLQTLSAVCDQADVLIDQLNGLMPLELYTDIKPVSFKHAIEICEDGTRLYNARLKVEIRRPRLKLVQVRPDGSIVEPIKITVAEHLALIDRYEKLGDAVIFFGRQTWFDVYKALECLEDHVGGERSLIGRNWIESREFKRLKRTANSFRHRPAAKHKAPDNLISHEEALELLATLIREALLDAKGRIPGFS